MTDDCYIRLHRAQDYFLVYGIRGNVWRAGTRLIQLCLQFHRIDLWTTSEDDFAALAYMKLPAFRKALRKLEQYNVIRCECWVGVWRYEVRSHYEWKPLMSKSQWWRWARATIALRRDNPASLGAYQHEWSTVVGNDASKHSRPIHKDNRILYVACANGSARDWLAEESRRKLIIRRLRVKFGEVSKIEFIVDPPACE